MSDLIESIIRREGGTQVTMANPTAKYDFQPNDKGAHVAEVTEESHRERFLSAPEGFREYDGTPYVAESSATLGWQAPTVITTEDASPNNVKADIDPVTQDNANPAPAVMDPAPASNQTPTGYSPADGTPIYTTSVMAANGYPDSFTFKDQTISIMEVAQQAQQESGLSVDEWNRLSEDERAEKIDNKLDDLDKAAGGTLDTDQEAARVAYKEKFNKLPHWRWSAEKIKAALATDDGKVPADFVG